MAKGTEPLPVPTIEVVLPLFRRGDLTVADAAGTTVGHINLIGHRVHGDCECVSAVRDLGRVVYPVNHNDSAGQVTHSQIGDRIYCDRNWVAVIPHGGRAIRCSVYNRYGVIVIVGHINHVRDRIHPNRVRIVADRHGWQVTAAWKAPCSPLKTETLLPLLFATYTVFCNRVHRYQLRCSADADGIGVFTPFPSMTVTVPSF